MKGSVTIPDRSGHTPLLFDTERPEGYTEETGVVYESLEVVRERVKREMEVNHCRLATLTHDRLGEMVNEFDPEKYPNVILVHGIQGG
jgi:hypothetical protein